MTSEEFDRQYARLNLKQRQAVDTIEGPVMVIAGPGTGKTSVLTLRVANILWKTDADPGSILALTFTESGAHSMRQKLVEVIGSAAYKVNIHTFHSFSNECIQTYPEEFPRITGSQPAGKLDQIRILEDIFDRGTFDMLKPHGNIYYYVHPVLSAISDIKRENVSTDRFADLVKGQELRFEEIPEKYHEKGKFKGKLKGEYERQRKLIAKNKELSYIYREYERSLAAEKIYDYDDMLLEMIAALGRRPEFSLMLQEEYQYILADEHQDANNAQNAILELLSSFHDEPNLFIVGDEKQAIYRFQGASLENFLYFKRKYPTAQLINLEENYRSTQAILDVSHSVIENNTSGGSSDIDLRVRLIARASHAHERNIEIAALGSPESEADYVAECIDRDLQSGVAAQNIALLYRDNNDIEGFASALSRKGVPFVVLSDGDALRDEEMRKFMLFLRAIDSPHESRLLAMALHFSFLNADHLDAWKAIRYAETKRMALIDCLRSPKHLIDAGVEGGQKMAHLSRKIIEWGKFAKNENVVRATEKIADESGFIKSLIARPDSAEKLEVFDGVLREMRAMLQNHKGYGIADFLRLVDLLETHKVRIKSGNRRPMTPSVHAMTAHKSKGLEFERVYIVRAEDGHWGNRRAKDLFDLPLRGEGIDDFQEIEDERRLFFVALTRAKRSITVTFSRTRADGKEQLPSQFIGELDRSLIENVDTSDFEKRRQMVSAKLDVRSTDHRGVDIKDREYLRKLFFEEGLSVTALNNYLSCPWRYFFNNLVRLPKTPESYQLYGNAIHAALREFFDALSSGRVYGKNELVASFERELLHQPLSENESKDALKRGTKALSGYFDQYDGQWRTPVITEFNIAGVFLDLSRGEKMLIKGRLDKVEMLPGGTRVNVVDYKTGKPKSRNDILGETKSSEGNIKRQLNFYKLLLDRYEKGKYDMVSGEIDFVEPNERGKYKRELFEVRDEDVQAVEEEAKRVGDEISNFLFWDKNCDDPKCEWCDLSRLVRGNNK